MEVLYPGAKNWVLVEKLPTYRLFTAMTTLGDKAYLIGGGEVNSEGWIYHDKVLVYNSTTRSFQESGILLL